MMKLLARFAMLAIVIVLLGSCTSGRRMSRILPFGEKKEGLPDPERFNGWPLVYHDAGATSVLWPFMDFDDKGFAIRPFLVKDEDDVSVLWPLSGWNTTRGDGWFLNVFFDFKPEPKYFTVFPIAHMDLDDGWGYVLPAYWNKSGWGVFPISYVGEDYGYALTAYWAREHWGVFPLMHAQKDMSGGYVFPFFWGGDSFGVFPILYHSPEFSLLGPAWRDRHGGGLFPLYTYYDKDGRSNHNVLGLLANVSNTATEHESWIFPLYYLNKGLRDWNFLSVLGGGYSSGAYEGLWITPLMWYEGGPNNHHRLLLPLFYSQGDGESRTFISPLAMHGSDADSSWTWAFPTWFSNSDPRGSSAALFPIWRKWSVGAETSSYLLPLYYHNSTPTGSTLVTPLAAHGSDGNSSWTWVLPTWLSRSDPGGSSAALFPIWRKWNRGEEESSYLLPLYYHTKSPGGSTLVTPLAAHGSDANSSWTWAFPTWFSHSDPRGSSAAVFPIWRKWNRGAEESSYLLPLYYHTTSPAGSTLLTPLAAHGSAGDSSWTWAFPTWFSKSSPGESSAYLWPVWGQKTEGDSARSWLFPLYYRTAEGDESHVFTPLGNRSVTAESRTLNVYPLWWNTEDDEGEVQVFLPFYMYREHDGKKSIVTPLGGYGWDRDDSFVNVLGPLYHSQKSADGNFELTAAAWPLYTKWRDRDETREYVPLVYSRHETPDRLRIGFAGELGQINIGEDGTSWMFWPLACVSDQPELPSIPWNLTLYKHHQTASGSDLRITPLFYRKERGDRLDSGFFPFYDYDRNADGVDLDVLLFMGDYTRDDTGTSWRAWPFFAKSNQPRRPDPLYHLSLAAFNDYGDSGSWWVTPFVGSVRNGEERFSWALPLGWWESDENSFSGRYLMGLSGLTTENGALKDFYLFPTVAINKDATGSSWRVWPLAANSTQRERPDILHYASLWSRHDNGTNGSWWMTPLVGSVYHGADRFTWALPLGWWETDENSFDGRFLLGLAGLETENGELREFDLFPSVAINKDATGSSWRVWPLAANSTQRERPDILHYASLWSRHDNGTNGSWWMTPLVGSVYHGADRFTWALPLGWWETDENSFDGRFLLGLAGLETENGEFREFDLFPSVAVNADATGSSWRVWPLAANSGQRHRPDILHYLSIFSRHEYNNAGSWWLTPFVGSVHDGEERVSWALPLGWCESDENSFDGRFLMGLGGLETESGTLRDFDLFPLVSFSNDTDPFFLHDIYLFNWHATRGDGYDFGIFPILGMHSSGTLGVDAKKRFSILGRLGYCREYVETPRKTTTSNQVLLLGYNESNEFRGNLIPGISPVSQKTSHTIIFPFYFSDSKEMLEWKPGVLTPKETGMITQWWTQTIHRPNGTHSDAAVISLLQSKGTEVRDIGRSAVKQALVEFAKENSRARSASKVTSWVHTSTRDGEDKKWSVLLGLINHKTDAAADESRTRVLGFFYRSDREGAEVRRTFFPFCSWDNGKNWSESSFLWRIWRKRKENGKTSGYFLFIPWGKK